MTPCAAGRSPDSTQILAPEAEKEEEVQLIGSRLLVVIVEVQKAATGGYEDQFADEKAWQKGHLYGMQSRPKACQTSAVQSIGAAQFATVLVSCCGPSC